MTSEQGAESLTAGLRARRAVGVMVERLARGSGRLALIAGVGLTLVAVVHAGSAEGGVVSSWRAHLAPAGTCAGAENARATLAVQQRAVRCLVNWARVRDAKRRLAPSRALRQAAALKGRRVAACRELSHTPCDVALTSAVRASGYRFSTFGENIYAATRGATTARQVVAAWLRSPAHRAILLHAGFRDLGATRVSAPRLLGGERAIVWVAAFAAPG